MATRAVENSVLAEDLDRLAESGLEHTLLSNGAEIGIVVRDVPLPRGIWSEPLTHVLLRTTILYPQSAMDMFWTCPQLRLANGAEPQASNLEVHFGETWRRFSWHPNTEWIPGRDDLLTHLEFALARLNDAR